MVFYHVRKTFSPLSAGKSKFLFHQPRLFTSSPRFELDTKSKPTHDAEGYDIVIVGGGVVGLALANAFGSSTALRQLGYRISLLEASDLSQVRNWKPLPNQWSSRVAAITNESLKFLNKIGAYQYLDLNRTCPVKQMQMWDGISNSRITFNWHDGSTLPPSEYAEIPPMARFMENIHLQKALLQSLHNYPNIEVYDSVKVANISADQTNSPVINLNGGRCLRTRLLIGADGFNSPVKSCFKITSSGHNYPTQCVVGILELVRTQDNSSVWQRLLSAGLKALDSCTLASAINACLSLPNEVVNQLLSRIGSHSQSEPIDSANIQSLIDGYYSSYLHSTESLRLAPKVLRARTDTIATFPLRNFHADQYLVAAKDGTSSQPNGTVLVGDAAHVTHPMAGQGLNMGLGDVKELSTQVIQAVEKGSTLALQAYSRSRYVANYSITTAIDQLYKSYALDAPPIVSARSAAMEVLNGLPSVKAFMMATAGGSTHGSPFNSASEMWSNVATVYEGVQKAKVLAQGLGSIAAGVAISKMTQGNSSKW